MHWGIYIQLDGQIQRAQSELTRYLDAPEHRFKDKQIHARIERIEAMRKLLKTYGKRLRAC